MSTRDQKTFVQRMLRRAAHGNPPKRRAYWGRMVARAKTPLMLLFAERMRDEEDRMAREMALMYLAAHGGLVVTQPRHQGVLVGISE